VELCPTTILVGSAMVLFLVALFNEGLVWLRVAGHRSTCHCRVQPCTCGQGLGFSRVLRSECDIITAMAAVLRAVRLRCEQQQ
jgi:hypothetical protein